MLKKTLKRSFVLWKIRQKIEKFKNAIRGGYVINNKGCTKLFKDIKGKNNRIIIGEGSRMDTNTIYIRGNNNQLVIGNDCIFGKDCSFRLEGNNIKITIGDKSTFTRSVNFTAQEDGSQIIVGEDCMFSNTIVVRTSDSHPIYSLETKERLNPAESVFIGKHVWVAPNTKIMKGADIGDGSVIGSDTMINRKTAPRVLVVGMPARVVKENIEWTRDKLF